MTGEAIYALQDRFNLDPQQAKVLLALFADTGRAMRVDVIHAAVSNIPHRYRSGIVPVRISQIRSLVGRDIIETVWGRGYRLSGKGRVLVGQALERLAA